MVNKSQKEFILRIFWIILFIIALLLLYFSFRPNPINFQIVPISPFQITALTHYSNGFIGI